MRAFVVLSLIGLTFGGAPSTLARRHASPAQAAIPNPHRHAEGDDVLKDVAADIRVVAASAPAAARRGNVVENKAKTFRAFTVETEDGMERIFVEDVNAGKTYEIEGVAWPNRPLSDPVWAGDYFICDRSSNPRAAIHYAFDMRKRALVAARAFSE
jgi:hypothetical protein